MKFETCDNYCGRNKNLSLKTLETLIYEEISKAKADQNKIRRAGVILSERDLNGFLIHKGGS